jgi:hypothetical protein
LGSVCLRESGFDAVNSRDSRHPSDASAQASGLSTKYQVPESCFSNSQSYVSPPVSGTNEIHA